MRTVLMTAVAATVLMGFAARGAERDQPPVVLNTACIASDSPVAHTYAAPDPADCCNANSHCSQYISTQTLIKDPGRTRT